MLQIRLVDKTFANFLSHVFRRENGCFLMVLMQKNVY